VRAPCGKKLDIFTNTGTNKEANKQTKNITIKGVKIYWLKTEVNGFLFLCLIFKRNTGCMTQAKLNFLWRPEAETEGTPMRTHPTLIDNVSPAPR